MSRLKPLLWKEWREQRWVWLALLVVASGPALGAAVVQGFAGMPAMSAGPSEVFLRSGIRHQAGILGTAGLALAVVFAVVGGAAELTSKRVLFLLDRPLRRWHVVVLKFVVGGVALALCWALSFAITLTAAAVLLAVRMQATLPDLLSALAGLVPAVAWAAAWAASFALAAYALAFFLLVATCRPWLAVFAGLGVAIATAILSRSHMFDWIDVVARGWPAPEPDSHSLLERMYVAGDPAPLLVGLGLAAAFCLASVRRFESKEH